MQRRGDIVCITYNRNVINGCINFAYPKFEPDSADTMESYGWSDVDIEFRP